MALVIFFLSVTFSSTSLSTVVHVLCPVTPTYVPRQFYKKNRDSTTKDNKYGQQNEYIDNPEERELYLGWIYPRSMLVSCQISATEIKKIARINMIGILLRNIASQLEKKIKE